MVHTKVNLHLISQDLSDLRLQFLPINKCNHINHLWRREFCGLVVGIDEGIKNLTLAAINDLGNNTVIIFSSDNGGSQWFGGINYPLKGILLSLYIIYYIIVT